MTEPHCDCTTCATCRGSGCYYVDMNGQYVGSYMRDALDDLESCEDCGGSGIAEMCDYCQDQRERDEDAHGPVA